MMPRLVGEGGKESREEWHNKKYRCQERQRGRNKPNFSPSHGVSKGERKSGAESATFCISEILSVSRTVWILFPYAREGERERHCERPPRYPKGDDDRAGPLPLDVANGLLLCAPSPPNSLGGSTATRCASISVGRDTPAENPLTARWREPAAVSVRGPSRQGNHARVYDRHNPVPHVLI